MSVAPLNLIWIDLEMTGLDTAFDAIIEIATVVTSPDLTVLEEGPSFAIHQSEEVLECMDEWNQKHHTNSGLIEKVRQSNITYAEAEKQTLKFLKQWAIAGNSPMCGNSVCQDRRFLARLMPALELFFHYRNLDVSTLKELAKRWKPEIMNKKKNHSSHRALDDIYASIEELKLYREGIMNV